MKQLILSTITVLALSTYVVGQIHYVPAQIFIPALNLSTYNNTNIPGVWGGQSTNNSRNNTQFWNGTKVSDGHLIAGNIGNLDRLLFNQVYLKTSRWWASRESTIEYPKDMPGGYVRHETISAIRIYNQFYDGHNSRARILNGGIGRKTVKIQLRSNVGKGFKYVVQIFGH